MDEEKFQKSIKDARWFAIGLLILVVIIFLANIFNETVDFFTIIIKILQMCCLIATIKGYSEQKKYGAICGIITSTLLIISTDIISLIFGILYLIDCIKILNYMKNV